MDNSADDSLSPDSLEQNSPAPCICLVTGCAGFLGSHLTQALLEQGHFVIGVDNLFSGKPENMQAFRQNPRFHFLLRSIAEPGLWEEIFRQHGPVHSVFHLAAIVSLPYSMAHPEETLRINFQAAQRLLEAAEAHGAVRFVFAGSAMEYGAAERSPLRETDADEAALPPSPYGDAKLRASRRVAASPIGVALRCFNVFGPRQDPLSPYSGVISRFLSQALAHTPLTIAGDGEQTRDFLYVQDAVRAFLDAAGLGQGPALPPGVYNLGTGRAAKILALACTVLILTDRPTTILMDSGGPGRQQCGGPACNFSPARPDEPRHSVADISAITGQCGWRPEIVLSVGLARTIAWYRQQAGELTDLKARPEQGEDGD